MDLPQEVQSVRPSRGRFAAKSRHLAARNQYDEAMECLLEAMRIDRNYEDDAPRKGLLALFDLLGGEHPSVQKYRRKLFTLLH